MRTLNLGVTVSDREASVAFYTALGYEIVGEVPESPLGHLTMLKLPDDEFVSLELVDAAGAEPVTPSGISHLVIQVESMRSAVYGLTRKGIDVEPPSSPDGSDEFWTAWLTDPDGYRIELVQWPEGHAAGMTAADFPEAEQG